MRLVFLWHIIVVFVKHTILLRLFLWFIRHQFNCAQLQLYKNTMKHYLLAIAILLFNGVTLYIICCHLATSHVTSLSIILHNITIVLLLLQPSHTHVIRHFQSNYLILLSMFSKKNALNIYNSSFLKINFMSGPIYSAVWIFLNNTSLGKLIYQHFHEVSRLTDTYFNHFFWRPFPQRLSYIGTCGKSNYTLIYVLLRWYLSCIIQTFLQYV